MTSFEIVFFLNSVIYVGQNQFFSISKILNILSEIKIMKGKRVYVLKLIHTYAYICIYLHTHGFCKCRRFWNKKFLVLLTKFFFFKNSYPKCLIVSYLALEYTYLALYHKVSINNNKRNEILFGCNFLL